MTNFIPDRLTFRHGMPYQLHLENHGKDLHEFTAPEFLAAVIVRNPATLSNGRTGDRHTAGRRR